MSLPHPKEGIRWVRRDDRSQLSARSRRGNTPGTTRLQDLNPPGSGQAGSGDIHTNHSNVARTNIDEGYTYMAERTRVGRGRSTGKGPQAIPADSPERT